jgi:predicted pyridoxine 5'-phosphate oxidase superfamily flavin-nucleotide-binding protein
MQNYHPGEIAVQSQAGVRLMAERIGKSIRNFMPTAAIAFLEQDPFVVACGVDDQGRVWASALSGTFQALDEQNISAQNSIHAHDPLYNALINGALIGTIFIEFATRRRMRVNGRVKNRRAKDFDISLHQVYTNCAKHIHPRNHSKVYNTLRTTALTGSALTAQQQQWIEKADTMFIASFHPEGGGDASHRGGPSGFVRVVNENYLQIPDYSGNLMFNTLGNIVANSAVGLLFIDFDTGQTLQISGTARLDPEDAILAEFDRANHVIGFHIQHIIETKNPETNQPILRKEDKLFRDLLNM